jgi:hypothetical protein
MIALAQDIMGITDVSLLNSENDLKKPHGSYFIHKPLIYIYIESNIIKELTLNSSDRL